MEARNRSDGTFEGRMSRYEIIHRNRVVQCSESGIPLATLYRNNLDDPTLSVEEFYALKDSVLYRRNLYLISRRYRKEQRNAIGS